VVTGLDLNRIARYALAGVAVLFVSAVLVVTRSKPTPPVHDVGAGKPSISTNSIDEAASAVLAGGDSSPDVAVLMARMSEWRVSHPSYHVLVETTGKELASRSEVYRLVDDKGDWTSRMRNDMTKPVKLSYVVQADKERLRAFFPQSNQVVGIATQAEMLKGLLQLGWTGGEVRPDLLLKLARASFVEVGTNFTALTLVFPGATFHLPPIAKEVFVTIKLDPAGKPLELEQLTLGQRVISRLTYLTNDPGQWSQAAPTIPEGARFVSKTFQQVVQEEVILASNKPKPSI